MTSPLLRTRETAALILARQSDPAEPEPQEWLAEIDHGPDENMPEAMVVDRIGAGALEAWETESIAPRDWLVDREARLEGWRHLFARQDAATTLLVTSNGAARFALLADPDLAAQASHLPSLKLRTGAFGVIRIAEGRRHVTAWDRRP